MYLRIKYGKVGAARFFSHLEMQEMWKRAFRRAGLPVKLSQGYNPQPKISFGSALPVGAYSLGEYMDVELKETIEFKDLSGLLSKYLPIGIKVFKYTAFFGKQPSLMAVLNRADYVIIQEVEECIKNIEELTVDYLKQGVIEVESNTKRGKKIKDIKKGIIRYNPSCFKNKLYISALVQSGSEGNIKPKDLLESFLSFSDLKPRFAEIILRKGLYIQKDNKLITPLDILKG